MEVLLYIFASLIALGGLFLLIEYPYHFIGVFIFIIHYQFNITLPGPIDLRGWLTIILSLRLIVFDKENLIIIFEKLFKNHLFVLILIFDILFIGVTYVNTNNYIMPIRLFVFRMLGLILGFLAVYRGYTMQTFFIAIVVTAIIGTIDLIYSFAISSELFVRRVLDILIKSEYSTDLNHNLFGFFNAIALAVTYIMIISKQLVGKKTIVLIIIFGMGILLSTSRSNLLTVLISIVIGTVFLPKDKIDVKKIFIYALKGFAVMLIILGGYLFTLSSLNINSEFSSKIHYRLVEEPMGLIEGKTSKFRGTSQYLKEGSASWRINKAIRDFHEFFKLNYLNQLFGFGYNGYFIIGEKDFDRYNQRIQAASHNGLASIIIERGIIGLVLFFIINLLFLRVTVKKFRSNISVFPFYIIVIFSFFYTFGAVSFLLNRFGYILIGGIIGQALLTESSPINDEKVY